MILEEREGWQTSLVFDAGCGVWCVKSFQLYPELACPEIVACDDRGRGTILISYSGKWTPKATVLDGRWLAPMDQGRFAMGEGVLLLGGAGGRLYEVRPRAAGHADILLRAEFPGEEIHTIITVPVATPKNRDRALIFLMSGRVFEYRCPESGDSVEPSVSEIQRVEGRVRDALIAPAAGPLPRRDLWTVSRAGQLVRRRLEIVRDQAMRFTDEVILTEPQGLGRLSRGVGRFADCLYLTRDDGVYLRIAPDGQGGFSREVIHRGEQGPRGLVAGRFADDPETETLAIFGYSGKVELLERKGPGPFTATTLFVDRDKGHWLAKAELDGRNETEEIIASGYSGRVVLLSRERADARRAARPAAPGSDAGKAESSADSPAAPSATGPEKAPLRVAVEAIPPAREIDPYRYGGGFFTKSATFATLLSRDDQGQLAPGLARQWWFEDEGRSWFFRLAAHGRFQDGSPIDAASVAAHFRRLIGAREHSWLGLARQLRQVDVVGEDLVVFRLNEPWAVEEDILAVNPCGLRAPAALDAEGRFLRPLGSGPLRPEVETMTRDRLRYVDADGHPAFELVAVEGGPAGFRRAIADGRVDLVIDGWERRVDRGTLEGGGPRDNWVRLKRRDTPRNPFFYLVPNAARPGLDSAEGRRALLPRTMTNELIRTLEGGQAKPVDNWAGTVAEDGGVAVPESGTAAGSRGPLRLLVNRAEPWQADVARALRAVAAARGPGIELAILEPPAYDAARAGGDFDLLVDRSWGGPYDPHLSLISRFGPDSGAIGPPVRFLELVAALAREPDQGKRANLLAQIDRMIEREAVLIPLHRPVRLALTRVNYDLPLDPYRILR